MPRIPPSRKRVHRKKVASSLVLLGTVAVICIPLLYLYQNLGPSFDDSGAIVFGLSDWGLDDDLERFKSHLEEGKPPPPVKTSSIPSIWQDDGNVFYTRSYHGFDTEVICKVKDRNKMPRATQYGVVRWSRHLDGDYFWILLRS